MSKKYVRNRYRWYDLKAGVVDETGTLLSAAKTPLQFTTPKAFVETLAGPPGRRQKRRDWGGGDLCRGHGSARRGGHGHGICDPVL